MVKVKSIKDNDWPDLKAKVYRHKDDVWEVSEARAEELIAAGYAVKDDTEPQSSDTYAVKDEPEYYRKSKRSRGVDGWTNDQ